VEGIGVKADKTRKESRGRAIVKESSSNLPNNGNIWQTTEPVRLENKQVISIIGLLNHQNLPAQVTSLSF